MDQALLRIGAVSRATGIAVSTLRSWEARYGLPTPARTTGGHRLYARLAVKQVHDVQALVKSGASTAAAAALVIARDAVPAGDVSAGHASGGDASLAQPPGRIEVRSVGGVVPLEELLIRTRAAKAESRRLRAELTLTTEMTHASLDALHDRARLVHGS